MVYYHVNNRDKMVLLIVFIFHFDRVMIENHRNNCNEIPLRRNELYYSRELDLLVFNLYFTRKKIFKKL
jgi:hypothetical protein